MADYEDLMGSEGRVNAERLTSLTHLLNSIQDKATCINDVINAVATCLSTYQYLAQSDDINVALLISVNLLI